MSNVEYIDHMGTDLSIVNDARVSFGKRSEWEYFCTEHHDCVCLTKDPTKCNSAKRRLAEKDVNLINYLARGMPKGEWETKIYEIANEQGFEVTESAVKELIRLAVHWVPFAHTAIKLRMKAPVPIRTQCFKHKIGFVESEESRRYIKSTPELYIPKHFHTIPENIKQGSGDIHERSEYWKEQYLISTDLAIISYEEMIKDGIAPEEARFILPQGVYVNWIWTGNLAAFARYYNQRSDSHAQRASNELAEDVAKVIEPLFPISWKALTQ